MGWFKAAWSAMFALTVALWAGYEIAALTQCIPISLFWSAKTQSLCRANFTPSLILSIVNSILDVAIFILPMPAISQLQAEETKDCHGRHLRRLRIRNCHLGLLVY